MPRPPELRSRCRRRPRRRRNHLSLHSPQMRRTK